MYFVYLLASRRNGTLYCGVTNDLVRRTWEHRNGGGGAFTTKYKVHQLVWFEAHASIEAAIIRETRIKGWLRIWKVALIEEANVTWRDLYSDLLPHPLHETPPTLPSLSFRPESRNPDG